MLRIALAQINPTVGDLDGNRKKIDEYIKKARQLSANIIVFPELAITGYPPEDLLLKKHFVDDNLKTLKLLVSATANVTAIIGFVDRDRKGCLYNAAAVIHNKKLRGVYHKRELPNYGVFDEKRYFTPGKDNKVFTIGKTTIGVSICEDIWASQGSCQEQARGGAKVLINLSSSPYHVGKSRAREQMLIKQARKNKAFVCYANLVGGQDELVFDGASIMLSPKGRTIASGKQFEEDLVVADLKTGFKRKFLRRMKIKRILITKTLETKGKLFVKGQKAKRLKSIEEIYKALVLGTRDYVRKNGFQKAVIGLSGGIDSALTTIIAADAIGRENIIAVSMPSPYSSIATRLDARRMAENLGIPFKDIPIKGIFRAYIDALKREFADQKPDIAEENIQARIRGNLLMALSNKFSWLVLTTGNKSEIAVGYCTLYGDMAGGFAVIKDIPKTKVYELARYRNSVEGRELIAQSVIKRAPTAELKENQRDQDTLPAYSVLDPILEAYIEKDKSLTKIKTKKGSPRLIKRVVNMVDRMEYKRRQSPPGIKITPKAFGKDRRLPITNRYKEK